MTAASSAPDRISDFVGDDDVLRLVHGWTLRAPDAPALVQGGRIVSYGRLGRDSDGVAAALEATLGGDTTAEVVVPLVLDRSPDLITAMLAVWKAGLAYSVVDPAEPAMRMSLMLRDVQVPMVVTRGDLVPRLPHGHPPKVMVDSAPSGPTWQPHEVNGKSLAYVLYTSGSSGTPKGVMVTREALANLSAWQRRALQVTPSDRASQLASPSFDGSNGEIWPYLTAGASIHFVDDLTRVDPKALLEWLRARGITRFYAPTSLAELLLIDPGIHHTTLQTMMVGGDVLHRRPPTEVPFTLLNLYGPTESTVTSTCGAVLPTDADGPAPAGYPIDRTTVRVLDSVGRESPVGVTGEVYIGGIGVARGYYNQPAMTAASFIPDPFADTPGARMYRTGDLAYRRPDGALVVLGRQDGQVKIRGSRVELGEIETALMRHPAVRAAAAVVTGEGTRSIVIGHVAFQPGSSRTEEELKAHVEGLLPSYMNPARVIVHPSLPLTQRGKVDRLRLSLHVPPEPGEHTRQVPLTAVEQQVVAAAAAVLNRQSVDVDLSFTQNGGHSLLAAQAIGYLREHMGVDVPVAPLLRSASLAAFASELERLGQQQSLTPGGTRLTPRHDPQAPVPLSYAQEEVWFLEKLSEDNRAYNAQCTVHFNGALRVDLLERALNEVVERHEILRTSFLETPDGVHQIVTPSFRHHLSVVDLSYLAEEEQSAAFEQVLRDEVETTRFDLGRLPLVRWKLVRLGPNDHVLIQVEHHFVHDGWSQAVMWGEVETCYKAWATGREPQLAPLHIQYADYAVWQRLHFAGEYSATSLRHWANLLRDLPEPVDLPFAKPRPPRQTFHGNTKQTEFDGKLYEALRRFSRRESVSLFVTMYAAYAALLHRYTGATDLLIGSAVANRHPTATAELIGMMVNTIVLRLRARPQMSFRQLVQHARDVVLDSLTHQDTPFPEVVRTVRPPRDASRNPIVQTCFSFHDSPVPELAWPDVTGRIVVRDNRTAKFDLSVIIVPRAEQRAGRRSARDSDPLTVIWEYNTDLLDDSSVDRMIGHYETVLRTIIDSPQTLISQLPLLTDHERHELARWNASGRPIDADDDVLRLVKEWVERTPSAPAIVASDRTVSYGELGRESDALAAVMASALGGSDAGNDVIVPLFLDRSPDLFVGMLAAWKAGCAYSVVDPNEPSARLSLMLGDMGARLMVTRRNLSPRLPANHPPLVFTDAVPVGTAAQWPSRDGSVAYVLYTSGSTGTPKGVVVTREALSNLCTWQRRALQVVPIDRASQLALPSFDGSKLEIWPYLSSGASIHLIDDATRIDPSALLEWICSRGISRMFAPTPLAELLLAQPGIERVPLRTLMTGGDVLHGRFPSQVPFEMLNLYGPTEATVASTYAVLEPGAADGPAPVGLPIDNTTVRVLNAAGNEAPVGVPGEVYIGGAGVARGYHNQPALTAAAFLPDPFSDTPGTRMYRTGDVAYRRPDGELVVLGRRDQQVKVRGARVELGEVEAALFIHSDVAACAVRLWQKEQIGRQALVAYVVPKAGAVLDPNDIRRTLGARVPRYMVPTDVQLVSALPLTERGKVDYTALEPPGARSAPDTDRSPHGEEARLLCRLLAELLGVDHVDPDDDFYSLGGHSLLAMRLSARLRAEYGITLRVGQILETPKVADLAALTPASLGGTT